MDSLQMHREELFEGFSLFSLILIVLIAFATSLSIEVHLLFALIGFFPAILTISLAILLYEESKLSSVILWILPFLIVGAFYLLVSNQLLIASNMDVSSLVLINLAICFLYLGILYLLLNVLNKKYS